MGPADEGVEVPDMLCAANTGGRLSRQPVFRKQLSRQSSVGEEAGQRSSLGTSLIRQNRVRGEMRRRRNPLMARVKEEVVNEVKELLVAVRELVELLRHRLPAAPPSAPPLPLPYAPPWPSC